MIATRTLLVALLVALSTGAFAQDFTQAARRFSSKKMSTITLKDGTVLEGTLADLDRKKGIIKSVKMEIDGKKQKFKPEQIQSMFLMPTALNKAMNAMEVAYDASKWANGTADNEKFLAGYVMLEAVPLTFKRGKAPKTYLVQLINPQTRDGIRVYEDPFAKETMSAGVGGVKVAGGNAKSYYLRKGAEPAVRVKKKNYDEEFAIYFGDCSEVASREDAGRWGGIVDHVNVYAASCAN